MYLGKQEHWVQLRADSIDKIALDESGFANKDFQGKPVNMLQVQSIEQHLLNYYEKNGYPFASIFLDSIRLADDSMKAILKINKGPLYHIDSIRVYGNITISNHFLQQYLGISKWKPI